MMLGRYAIFILCIAFSQATTIPLTPQEKQLLNSHTFRCISTGLWAPFNLIENDTLVGIGFDYWGLIRQKLHIENGCKKAESWTQVLDEIKSKTSDLTIAGQPTEERKAFAVFSKPYANYSVVIATKNDVGYIDDIALIKDKTIAIAKNYAVSSLINAHYPFLKIRYVESLDEALRLVERGKVYATIEILPVLAYKLNKNAFSNLKISGRIPYKYDVTIMFRKGYSDIIPIINKAIAAITQEERDIITQRWTTLHQRKDSSNKYLYLFVFFLLLLLFLVSVWLLRLYTNMANKNRKEKELKKLAYLDFLTSIYNRHMLDLTLDKEIALSKRHTQPLSIIFFDIDDFKKINDTYGHKTGDKILEELAALIKGEIRQSDIIGRWGGDEFLLILPNTDEQEAKKLCLKLYAMLEAHDFQIDTPVTCSFGVTEYSIGDTKEEMMLRADLLLYEHKSNE